jgi:hypothetical protein
MEHRTYNRATNTYARREMRDWTVKEIELKLEMPLDRAYLVGGTIPLWAVSCDGQRVLTRNEALYAEHEPAEFLSCCAESTTMIRYGWSMRVSSAWALTVRIDHEENPGTDPVTPPWTGSPGCVCKPSC